MNTETVLGHILPVIQAILKDVVSQMSMTSEAPTLYDLEAQTQAALPRIGQVIRASGCRRPGQWGGGSVAVLSLWAGARLS